MNYLDVVQIWLERCFKVSPVVGPSPTIPPRPPNVESWWVNEHSDTGRILENDSTRSLSLVLPSFR